MVVAAQLSVLRHPPCQRGAVSGELLGVGMCMSNADISHCIAISRTRSRTFSRKMRRDWQVVADWREPAPP